MFYDAVESSDMEFTVDVPISSAHRRTSSGISTDSQVGIELREFKTTFI